MPMISTRTAYWRTRPLVNSEVLYLVPESSRSFSLKMQAYRRGISSFICYVVWRVQTEAWWQALHFMHRKELELIQLNKKIVLFSRHALNSKGRSFSKEIQKAEQGRWTRHVSSRWVVARPKPFAVRLHYGKNADMEAVKEKYQDRPSQRIHWPGERWCSRHENTCEQVETSWNLSWRCRNIMTKLPCMTQDLAGVSYPLASFSLHPFIGCFTEIPGPLPPEVEFHGWPSAVQCFQNLHDGGSVNSMDSVSMPWKEEPLGSGMVLAARFYRR